MSDPQNPPFDEILEWIDDRLDHICFTYPSVKCIEDEGLCFAFHLIKALRDGKFKGKFPKLEE